MDLARLSGIPEGSRTWRRQQNILLFMEGDDHHRLRRLVSKAFTPRAVEALRPYTRTVIGGLIDTVFDADRCEAVESLTNPFPIPVICALVGIEPDRIDDMSRWAGVRPAGAAPRRRDVPRRDRAGAGGARRLHRRPDRAAPQAATRRPVEPPDRRRRSGRHSCRSTNCWPSSR